MRDVRHNRDASGDDQDQRKDYYYLFYDRVTSSSPTAITFWSFPHPPPNIIFANDIIQKPFSEPKT
jgi:hypothetical protein